MDIGWPEILIIAVVILVLFGSKKMPDAARAVGRSLRILKTEVKGLHDDDEEPAQPPAGALPPVPPTPPVQTTSSVAAPTAGERPDQP